MKLLIRFSSWWTKLNHGHSRFAKWSNDQFTKISYILPLRCRWGFTVYISWSQINVLKYSPRILQCMWCPNKTQISHNIAETQIMPPFQVSFFFLNLAKYRVHLSTPFHTSQTHSYDPIGNPGPPVHKEIIGGSFYTSGKASNNAAKETATCLSKGKKTPLITHLTLTLKSWGTDNTDTKNTSRGVQNEVINYLFPKSGRDLTGNSSGFPLFWTDKILWLFHDFSRFFSKFPGIFHYFNGDFKVVWIYIQKLANFHLNKKLTILIRLQINKPSFQPI